MRKEKQQKEQNYETRKASEHLERRKIMSTWLEADSIKQAEMKEKIRKEWESFFFCSRNLIKAINIWAVLFERFSGSFLKLTREEFRRMGQRIRKLMTMHEVLHPRNDIDRLYLSRKEGGRGQTSIEDCIYASTQGLKDYAKKSKEILITATNNSINNIRKYKQKNNKNKKTEMGRKMIILIFQVTN